MGERSEREAAYFALLRAREELAALQRCEEYLADELRRLRRSEREETALRASAPQAMRRFLRHSDTELSEVVQRRCALLEDELARMPARHEAAQDFVLACERNHDVLGGP